MLLSMLLLFLLLYLLLLLFFTVIGFANVAIVVYGCFKFVGPSVDVK